MPRRSDRAHRRCRTGGRTRRASRGHRRSARRRADPAAVVYLETQWSGYVFDETGSLFNDGAPYEYVSSCTGFVVNPDGYIATAGHCVDDGIEGARGAILEQVVDSIVAADPTVPYQVQYDFALANYETEGFEDSSPIDREVSVIVGGGIGNDAEGNALPAQVIDYQPLSEGDVALLKIEASELPSAELAPDADVAQAHPSCPSATRAALRRSPTLGSSRPSRTGRSAARPCRARCPSTRRARRCRRA